MSMNVPDSCCQTDIPFSMLDVQNHPTVTDLQRNMGKSLTDVYLKTCTPIERTLFGRDKPLKGPEKLLMIPPNGLSGNKVHLTPLFTESLQALTHQGVLEIGKKLERKFDEQNQLAIDKAVAEAEELAELVSSVFTAQYDITTTTFLSPDSKRSRGSNFMWRAKR